MVLIVTFADNRSGFLFHLFLYFILDDRGQISMNYPSIGKPSFDGTKRNVPRTFEPRSFTASFDLARRVVTSIHGRLNGIENLSEASRRLGLVEYAANRENSAANEGDAHSTSATHLHRIINANMGTLLLLSAFHGTYGPANQLELYYRYFCKRSAPNKKEKKEKKKWRVTSWLTRTLKRTSFNRESSFFQSISTARKSYTLGR